jgi:hypothetical protein
MTVKTWTQTRTRTTEDISRWKMRKMEGDEEDEGDEPSMRRGGIGTRGGIGSARADLGLSFAAASMVRWYIRSHQIHSLEEASAPDLA